MSTRNYIRGFGKTILLIFLSLFLLGVCLIIIPILLEAITFRFRLLQMERQIERLDHPPQSILLETRSKMTTLEGTMEIPIIFTGQLWSYPGDRQEVEAFYYDVDSIGLMFLEETLDFSYLEYRSLYVAPASCLGLRSSHKECWEYTYEPEDQTVYIIFMSDTRWDCFLCPDFK